MRVCSFIFLFTVSSILSFNEGYRILGVFPLNIKSPFMMFGQLMKGLAERGHQVDVVSHFPLEKPIPNYTDIVNLAGTIPYMHNNVSHKFMKSHLINGVMVRSVAIEYGGEMCDFMNDSRFSAIIKNPPKDPPYDLLITQVLGANCYLALGQHFGIPVVGVVSLPLLPWINDMIANPEDLAYVPHTLSKLDGQMNLWQRIQNVFGSLKAKLIFNYYSAYQNEKIRKYIGPHATSLREAEKNISLILVNSHHSLNGARPFTTAHVEVGGLHIPEIVEPLPDDLQKWLDDSEDGFVYVSFGSMVKIESFPKEFLDALYASLRKLVPVRVLMKIAKANELPPGLPSNVMTLPWIPQLAVLKHKRAIAFLTHGGLMGTQESVYCGVPMIGVPLFSDQIENMKLYMRKNIAVVLDHEQLTEKKLDAAFEAVLHDPSYMESAKTLSAEFRDRPMSPMDTAVFWVEYVVRHGGTNLRSPAMDLTWWQIALLDVYATLFLSAALILYLMIFSTKLLMRIVFTGNKKDEIHYKKS